VTAGSRLLDEAIDPPPHPMAAIKRINERADANMRGEYRIDTPYA
jgi:hypothetical protein